MPYDISEHVQEWTLEVTLPAVDFNDIHAAIEDLTVKRFNQYRPTKVGPYPDFRTRLASWLEQVSNEDQKVLFQLVPNIFFIGDEEFLSLYRAGFRTAIVKWLIDQSGLDFLAIDFEKQLNALLKQTLFCSITDWDLATFCRVNEISGPGIRPDLTASQTLSSATELLAFMSQHQLNRIIVVEDFIGSGTQMNEVETILTTLAAGTPMLIVPLVVCPAGHVAGLVLESSNPNISFDPILRPPPESFVAEMPSLDESSLFPQVRELVKRLYPLVAGGIPVDDGTNPYGPFGFGRTGGLIVLYSNCPDNSLPAIHYKSEHSTWSPLFPRRSRLDV